MFFKVICFPIPLTSLKQTHPTVPTNGGNIGGAYQCKATDPNTGMVVTATANVKVNIRPELTTSLSTSEIKKSSG